MSALPQVDLGLGRVSFAIARDDFRINGPVHDDAVDESPKIQRFIEVFSWFEITIS